MRSPTAVDDRAVQALLDLLPRILRIDASSDHGHELVLGDMPIVVKWAGDGSLLDVRRHLRSWSTPPDVVVARRMSPGARALLTDSGIGWVDETGSAEISMGPVLISRSGRETSKTDRLDRWSPSTIAIAEALLCGHTATVAAMTKATGLSTGSCTGGLRLIEDLGHLHASAHRGRRSARRVLDSQALLSAYCAAVAARPRSVELRVGALWQDPVAGATGLGKKLDEAAIGWAATGALASAVMAPFLSTVSTVDLYVDTKTTIGLEAAARVTGLRAIEGGRLTLRPFPTATAQRLTTIVDGLRVAPWPRVYVDLLGAGVRGEDAAEHLREVLDVG